MRAKLQPTGRFKKATVRKRPAAVIERSRKQTLQWLLDHFIRAQQE